MDDALAIDVHPACLRLQIEMILATHQHFARKPMRRAVECGIRITACDVHRRQMVGLGGNRCRQVEQGGQFGIVHPHQLRGCLCDAFVVSNDPGHGLTEVAHKVRWNQRLVVHDRTGLVVTGDVGGSQYRTHARQDARSTGVDGEDARMCMRRLHRVEAQQALGRMLLVGVTGASGDMAMRGFMLQCVTRHHRRSATNFANRPPANARR